MTRQEWSVYRVVRRLSAQAAAAQARYAARSRVRCLAMELAAALALSIFLSGCASYHAEQALPWVIGKTQPQLEAALGVPDKHDGAVLEWDYAKPSGASASVPDAMLDLLLTPIIGPVSLLSGSGSGSLSLTNTGSCRLIVTMLNGEAAAAVFAGDSAGAAGS